MLLRKTWLGLAAIVALSIGSIAFAAPALADEYAAIAAGVNGVGWTEGGWYTMESARAEAVRQCRDLGGSCSVSTAEHSNWYFSAGYCDDVPYTGASPQSMARADQIVRMKGAADGNYDCYIQHHF
jgi:hypothetical protein